MIPRFIYAWPSARIAVMGGDQAANTLLQIEVASLKSEGKRITPEKEQKLLQEIKQRYDQQTSPFYAAARLWVDAIIDPLDTRQIISQALRAANNNPETSDLKLGVFQV